MECMERLGWNVFGTEISPIAARRAKEIFPRQVFIGDPLELTFQENDYDCISIYHVLEHTQKPKEIIEKTYRLLKPGGLLLVAVPNIDCLSFNLLRSNWFGFGLPQNNYYFSLGVLSREIQKAGFNISHVRHFSMEQDPFSLLQGVLNRFVGNDNGLYHSLHRGNRPKQNAMIRACIYSLAASLFIPCLVMAWIFSKLSDGATVEIYAFKPHSS